MLYKLSDGGVKEIPNAWWEVGGVADFVPRSECYRAIAPDEAEFGTFAIVPILEVKPVYRSPSIALEFGGFDRDRLVRILRGFVAGTAMEPVKVIPTDDGRYKYAVYDGFHRFHASVAVNFAKLPVLEGKWGFSSVE